MYSIILKEIESELTKISEDLKQELKKDGHFATGRTQRSIRVELTPTEICIKSNKAPKYLTEGAEPVKSNEGGVLYNAIMDWVKAKRVTPLGMKDKTFAYLIYRKRVNKGYKVPNAYNSGRTVSKVIDIEKINKKIEYIVGKTISLKISSSIKI